MTVENVLNGEGSPSVWYGLKLAIAFDEEGNEVEQVNPTGGKGGSLSLNELNVTVFNTGRGSFQTTYKAQESDPMFLGWLVESPTNNNLLVII